MYNILICDDEKDIVSALKIYLTSAEYKTFEAYNGREAVELMKQWLAGREEFFTLPRIRVVNSEVDENFTMKIALEGDGDCTGVRFALWSEAEGKDDLQWYTAEKTDRFISCK